MKIEEMNIRLQIKRIKKKFCNFFKIVHIPQELRIRSRGTERHSALNRAKLSTFISYHYLLCDPCQEIQDDMPWMSFGLSRHLRRWNPQKADTIQILESVR